MKIMDDDEKAAEGVFLNSKLDFKVVSVSDFLPENQDFFFGAKIIFSQKMEK